MKSNMVYLESPAGVGFSISDYSSFSNDIITADDNLEALKLFFEKYPHLKSNDLYLAGQSYAGIYIPYFA
jgi:carboxypeptidase C (cathepsin A)